MKKLEAMNNQDEQEAEIHTAMQNNTIENFKYRNYNPEALNLLKPTLSIGKLVN